MERSFLPCGGAYEKMESHWMIGSNRIRSRHLVFIWSSFARYPRVSLLPSSHQQPSKSQPSTLNALSSSGRQGCWALNNTLLRSPINSQPLFNLSLSVILSGSSSFLGERVRRHLSPSLCVSPSLSLCLRRCLVFSLCPSLVPCVGWVELRFL